METENVNVKNWKSLIKPSKLDVKISDDLTHAKIIAEPLEKGYGLTLGNSLTSNLKISVLQKRSSLKVLTNGSGSSFSDKQTVLPLIVISPL